MRSIRKGRVNGLREVTMALIVVLNLMRDVTEKGYSYSNLIIYGAGLV